MCAVPYQYRMFLVTFSPSLSVVIPIIPFLPPCKQHSEHWKLKHKHSIDSIENTSQWLEGLHIAALVFSVVLATLSVSLWVVSNRCEDELDAQAKQTRFKLWQLLRSPAPNTSTISRHRLDSGGLMCFCVLWSIQIGEGDTAEHKRGALNRARPGKADDQAAIRSCVKQREIVLCP